MAPSSTTSLNRSKTMLRAVSRLGRRGRRRRVPRDWRRRWAGRGRKCARRPRVGSWGAPDRRDSLSADVSVACPSSGWKAFCRGVRLPIRSVLKTPVVLIQIVWTDPWPSPLNYAATLASETLTRRVPLPVVWTCAWGTAARFSLSYLSARSIRWSRIRRMRSRRPGARGPPVTLARTAWGRNRLRRPCWAWSLRTGILEVVRRSPPYSTQKSAGATAVVAHPLGTAHNGREKGPGFHAQNGQRGPFPAQILVVQLPPRAQ